MRKIFITLFALLFPLTVYAGSNIKQKDTGATVWENQGGDQISVGDPGLGVWLEDLSTASTAYVVSHKAGNIVKIYSVVFTGVDVDTDLDFRVGVSSAVFTPVSGGTGITIATAASAAGDVDSVTYTVGASSNLAVNQGDVITIHGDGAGGVDTDAWITIIIE